MRRRDLTAALLPGAIATAALVGGLDGSFVAATAAGDGDLVLPSLNQAHPSTSSGIDVVSAVSAASIAVYLVSGTAWAVRRMSSRKHVALLVVALTAVLTSTGALDIPPVAAAAASAAAAAAAPALGEVGTQGSVSVVAANPPIQLGSDWKTILSMGAVACIGVELLTVITFFLFQRVCGFKDDIPRRSKHLDKLERIDIACIVFSRMAIIPFIYHYLSYGCWSPDIIRPFEAATLGNTIGAAATMFLIYDAVYQPFHRFMHVPWFYPWVHKHHHRQKVPTRGNIDAVNVHPFEFLSGEYIHLLAVWLTARIMSVHFSAMFIFLATGSFITTLNHSRINVEVPGVIGSAYHDIHHSVYPYRNNFSQYTILWDRLYGTFDPQWGVPPPGAKKREQKAKAAQD